MEQKLQWLRDALGDPDGARWTPEKLTGLLEEMGGNLYLAASHGWVLTAGALVGQVQGGAVEMTVGQERYRLTSPADAQEFALRMAQYYRDQVTGSGRVLTVKRPGVL